MINPVLASREKLNVVYKCMTWMGLVFFVMGAPLFAQINIYLIRPDNPHFLNAREGILNDLGPGYQFHDMVLPSEMGQEGYALKAAALEKELKELSPKLVVLMNNKSTHLYRMYQKRLGPDADFPPALVIMSVYAGREVANLSNATGIAYEVQGVTSLVNLRSLIKQPINRIGVLYSPELKDFFVKQRLTCRHEEFELVGILVDEKPRRLRRTIKQGLKTLIQDSEVDAVWVLNDNRLLTPKLLRSAWAPVLRDADTPVIVGIRWMVLDSAGIGSFAVVPDHYALGQQAAGMILDIEENDWTIEREKVTAPISVLKILNASKLKGIGLNRAALLELDLLVGD